MKMEMFGDFSLKSPNELLQNVKYWMPKKSNCAKMCVRIIHKNIIHKNKDEDKTTTKPVGEHMCIV